MQLTLPDEIRTLPGMDIANHNRTSVLTSLLAMAASTGEDFDHFLAGWQKSYTAEGGTIFCQCGCSGCCSLAVNCTFPEAVRAAAALSAEQHERLRLHLHQIGPLAQAATTMPEWLRAHRTQSGGCPFLTAHGACGIYGARPASCRALLATREPRWCTMDFSTLASSEKQEFMASLDRSVVAFPLHYVAAAREYGERLERALLQAMAARYGFALYGNLPALVWLEREFGLSEAVGAGRAATEELLAAAGLNSPFIITIME